MCCSKRLVAFGDASIPSIKQDGTATRTAGRAEACDRPVLFAHDIAEAHRYVDQEHKRGNVVITVDHPGQRTTER